MPIPELLEYNYHPLSINDFIVQTNHIADKLEEHSIFKEEGENLPEYVSPPPKLRVMAGQLGQARDAASGGDRDKKAAKLVLRESLQLALSMNAQHITMVSLHRKDPSLLLNTGYQQKQKNSSSSKTAVNLLDATPEVVLKHGTTSGTVSVKVRRKKPNATVELQMTDQDPKDEASWTGKWINNKSRIEYKGLEPARRCHVRARYLDGEASGPWSSVVSIIVL